MEEIKEGMYVRSNLGEIAKITGVANDDTGMNLGLFYNSEPFIKGDIIGKPSYDITDLIEVGDYVNEHKVISVNTTFTYASVNVETSGEATCEVIPKKDIKSILTKEQMENMKYVIK